MVRIPLWEGGECLQISASFIVISESPYLFLRRHGTIIFVAVFVVAD